MFNIINITDNLRIRRINNINVAVERLVHDDEKNTDNWYFVNGNARGPFLPDEMSACMWILKHNLLNESEEIALEEAIASYKATAEKLEAALKAAIGTQSAI